MSNKSSQSSKGLSGIAKSQCIKITKKIQKIPISKFFLNPVDPIADQAPDYFEKIKKPMDLSKVLKNLKSDSYNSISEWKEDMNLIWKNAMHYNPKETLLYSIAKELSETFKDLSDDICISENEIWWNHIVKMNKKLQDYMETKP